MKVTAIITYSPLNKALATLLGDCILSLTKYDGEMEVLVEQAFTDCHSQTINNGLEKAKGDYIIISNEDVRAPQGWEILLEHFKDDSVWAVTPRETAAEPSINPQGTLSTDSKLALGSFFIISRKCYEEIGGYDVRFKPFLWDDTDYWRRITEKGKKIIVDDRVRVWHAQSVASKALAGEKYKEIYNRNYELYKEKWND